MKLKEYRSPASERRMAVAARQRQRAAGAKRLAKRRHSIRGPLLGWTLAVTLLFGITTGVGNGAIPHWRIALWIACSGIFCSGAAVVKGMPPYANTLALLPVADRTIARQSMRQWLKAMLLWTSFWTLLGMGIPADVPLPGAWLVAGLVAGTGLLAAAAFWGWYARRQWDYSRLFPIGLIALTVTDIFSSGKTGFPPWARAWKHPPQFCLGNGGSASSPKGRS